MTMITTGKENFVTKLQYLQSGSMFWEEYVFCGSFSSFISSSLTFEVCPGFDQDRVNFHQKPGGDTARRADPAWPKRTGCSIPCAAMLGSGLGSVAEGGRRSRGSGARTGRRGGESYSVHFTVCFVYSPYQYCCCYCSLRLLFLLNCPYPDPQVFCLFLSILLATLVEGEAIERLGGPLLLAMTKLQQSVRESQRTS